MPKLHKYLIIILILLAGFICVMLAAKRKGSFHFNRIRLEQSDLAYQRSEPLAFRKAAAFTQKPARIKGEMRVALAKLKEAADNRLLISTGIPFAQGQLKSEKNIAFFDGGGDEIPIAVRILARWPKDRSIRSILVQFQYTIEHTYQYVTLKWGAERATSDPEIVEPVWPYPQGMIVMPAQWLCDSQVIGEQVPFGTHRFQEYDDKIFRNLPSIIKEPKTGYLRKDGYYSTPHVLYQLYVRTGEIKCFLEARKELIYYREQHIIHEGKDKGSGTAGKRPRYVYVQAMADDYFLTGDPRTLEVATEMAEFLRVTYNPSDAFYAKQRAGFWTERLQAFPFLGAITYFEMTNDRAYLKIADGYMENLYKTQLEWPSRGGFIHNLYAHDPQEGARKDEYGGSPFMTGLLLEAVIKYHRLTGSDIAADSIFRALDWLISEGLSSRGDTFKYLTADKYRDSRGAPDLNFLVLHAFGYGYRLSGYLRQEYFDVGENLFQRGIKDAYVRKRKHFNQNYRSSGHYLAYVREGPRQDGDWKKSDGGLASYLMRRKIALLGDFAGSSGSKTKLKAGGRRAPAELYVSVKGHFVGGCTQNFPCREIGRAVSLAIPGDTVIIENGEYPGFTISKFQATQSNPLTIRAQDDNVRILPGIGRKDNRDNIYITHSDWIILDGISSAGAKRAGIRVDNSHNVTVKNGTFANNQVWGIFTNHSNDILIENNICYGSKEQHGIYFSNSADRPVIRGNKVFQNNGSGIQLNGDLSMGEGRNVKADGIIYGALIENNIVFNNGRRGGAAINMDGVQDSVIRNNLLYNNHATGIALFVHDGAAGPRNIKVYNNTVDMAPDSRWAIVVNKSTGPVTIMNNILYNRNKSRGALSLGMGSNAPDFLRFFGWIGDNRDSKNVYSDYNIYGGGTGMVTLNDNETRFGLDQWKRTKKDKRSFRADLDQLFVNADKGDYRLHFNSPAIDRGMKFDNINVAMDGTGRPVGCGIDIGAYEFVPGRN